MTEVFPVMSIPVIKFNGILIRVVFNRGKSVPHLHGCYVVIDASIARQAIMKGGKRNKLDYKMRRNDPKVTQFHEGRVKNGCCG